MDMDVVGRHALLFDDDATAAFVNSSDALVDWNSLLIDRFDVRHLLSSPPPPRRRRNSQQTHSPPSVSSIESELDHERYLDLPPPSEEQDEGAKSDDARDYHNVAFSYGNTNDSADQKNSADGVLGDSGFHPPFPVPESLLQSLPPTEKVHQIIARTAVFVSKHGGQSEIVLRVKQGDNPTFGFLMPDHHLHPYFMYLVDHQDLLQSGTGEKCETEKKGNTGSNQTDGGVAGALSLLGSVYESGEDEDGADKDGEVEGAPESIQAVSGKSFDVSDATATVGFEKTKISGNIDVKIEAFAKHSIPPKEKVQIPKRNSLTSALKSGTTNSMKKGDTSVLLSKALDNSHPSAVSNTSEVEQLIWEPPSDLKRLVDKIVEFIMRNGKHLEAVLIEQDSNHGRFPFLLPSNQYHAYYVKVLQKAQELKLTGKSFISEKDDPVLNGLGKKTHFSNGSDSLSSGSAGNDIPYDGDKKEKFRMVIGKSKKDGQDPPSKATQPLFGVNVDAAAAAAILQAATRGIKNPNFGFFQSTASLNGGSHGRDSEGEIQKSGDNSAHVPVAKDIAKTAALEAANEADSSEAHLTKEQRLKAERLKRAKMFVAMLKNGVAPGKTEPLPGSSIEPQVTGVSTSGNVVFNCSGKEREGISVPVDVNTSAEKEKSEKKYSDGYQERKSKRKYRLKSAVYEGVQEDGEEDDGEDEVEEIEEEAKGKDRKKSRKKHRSHRSSHEGKEYEEERDHGYTRKKHRSHHSSHQEDDEDERVHKRSRHSSHHEDDDDERDHKRSREKHWSYHSSEENSKEEDYEDKRVHKHSKRKHRSYPSSDEDGNEDKEEERNRKHSRKKKHKTHSSSRHRRDRHNHKERHRSSSKNKHETSCDEERLHHDSSPTKHPKSTNPEEELEEGEISSKVSDRSRGSVGAGISREASLDVTSSYRDRRAPSQSVEATEVSDDLRAKIRAMLIANL